MIYNYKADQRIKNKFEDNETLNKLELKFLPTYIQNNLDNFQKWLEK